MKSIVGLENLEPPEGGSAITIGTFDGVHLGHRALIARAVATAHELGCASCVLTWDKHPNEVVHPEKVPPLIATPERRFELLADRRPDMIVTLQFDRELSQWPPERFVEEVLVKGLAAKAVFVGANWRFGKGATGNSELLQKLGRDLGFAADPISLEEIEGERVSSSRIRTAVAAGDVRHAGEMLARPFDMDGVVVHGDARGQGLGFPTANVALDPKLVHPARGVYAGRARVNDAWYTAAINVGVNPTFGGDPDSTPLRVEAFLLDFAGDLYDRPIRIEFHERLRDEERFDSAEALVAQMHADVDRTRKLIEG